MVMGVTECLGLAKRRKQQDKPTRTGDTVEKHGVDWDAVQAEYDHYISTFTAQCPFHVFDTHTNRTIPRTELARNISAALKTWTRCPLTSTALMGTITNMIYAEYVVDERAKLGHRDRDDMTMNGTEEEWLSRRVEEVRPYVDSAMMKAGGVLVGDGDDEYGCKFISCLHSELVRYNTKNPSYDVPIPTILSAIRDLIAENRSHTSIPTYMVLEQIELLGQYAILSHRWEDLAEEELSFADFNDKVYIAAANKLAILSKFTKASKVSDKSALPLHAPAQKKGYKKLEGFRDVVKTRWGCRYLWMDSICISDSERSESIHQMFGWYRRAYVCAVYLSTRSASSSMASITGDPWCARGWTLQELLAPTRMECFAADWTFLSDADSKLSAFREGVVASSSNVTATPGHDQRTVYEPGVHQALFLFHAMCYRDTTLPEDRVYALFSALGLDLPVAYGEGFDRAFYRLQAECLSRWHDRRLLIWDDPHPGTHKRTRGRGSGASPYNSMLAADFKMFANVRVYGYYSRSRNYSIRELLYVPPEALPDPSISFDSDGMMRIMLSLHPWPTNPTPTSASASASSLTLTSEPEHKHDGIVFASLGTHFFSRDHYGVLLRPVYLSGEDVQEERLPSEASNSRGDTRKSGESVYEGVVYERIQFLRCSASSILTCQSGGMEWVYIR